MAKITLKEFKIYYSVGYGGKEKPLPFLNKGEIRWVLKK